MRAFVFPAVGLACAILLTSDLQAQEPSSISIVGSTPNPSSIHTALQITFRIDVAGGTPTGTVVISDGTDSCSASLPADRCLIRPSSTGSRQFVATYSGDAVFDGSSSAAVDHRVVAERLPQRISAPDGSVLRPTANADSFNSSVSEDGRYIAIQSFASNLVRNDSNWEADIFVYDRQEKTFDRVSVSNDGVGGEAPSTNPSISADGRFVAFLSRAGNLVDDDTNGLNDAFLFDRETRTIQRASLAHDGSQPNSGVDRVAVSGNGRYVAFETRANNLVPGDTNNADDVFLFDRITQTLELVSATPSGLPGNGPSRWPAVSHSGRFIAFVSFADNLTGTTYTGRDVVYILDRETGILERQILTASGNEPDSSPFEPSISADGRFLAFASSASNVEEPDSNGTADIYWIDRQLGEIKRASRGLGGADSNGLSFEFRLSADGQSVAFASFANNLVPGDLNNQADIFVFDVASETVSRVNVDSQGNEIDHASGDLAISGNGRFVTFQSVDDGLVAGDRNFDNDVFLHDRGTSTTGVISKPGDATQANQRSRQSRMSADGRYVTFDSYADNLTGVDENQDSDVFVHDRETNELTLVSSSDGESAASGFDPSKVADGRFVAFSSYATDLVPGDTNERSDVFIKDLLNSAIERVSVGPAGAEGNSNSSSPALSSDGRFVAFQSRASNLVGGSPAFGGSENIYLHDRMNGSTTLVSRAVNGRTGGDSERASISGDGRFVVFQSYSRNLVDDDNSNAADIFLYDRLFESVELISRSSAGEQGNGISQYPVISADGTRVAFESEASNLVTDDLNGSTDIFVHDIQSGTTLRVSESSAGAEGNFPSFLPSISDDGRFVAFISGAETLISCNADGPIGVYAADLDTGAIRLVSVNRNGEAENVNRFVTPSISGDAELISFTSAATNLTDDSPYAIDNVFLAERLGEFIFSGDFEACPAP